MPEKFCERGFSPAPRAQWLNVPIQRNDRQPIGGAIKRLKFEILSDKLTSNGFEVKVSSAKTIVDTRFFWIVWATKILLVV